MSTEMRWSRERVRSGPCLRSGRLQDLIGSSEWCAQQGLRLSPALPAGRLVGESAGSATPWLCLATSLPSSPFPDIPLSSDRHQKWVD